MQRIPVLLLVFSMLALSACEGTGDPGMKAGGTADGPWLGQPPPDRVPIPFAPGVVATHLFTRDIAATPDGRQIYWGVILGGGGYTGIAFSRRQAGGWTSPELAPFASDPRYQYMEPHISPDGDRFFFVSDRPAVPGAARMEETDIWVMDRRGDGWGEPRNLGAPVNSAGGEYFPSLARDGTLYFTRRPEGSTEDAIYRARPVPTGFSEPERLPAEVNAGTARFNAFVDPDQHYMIVPIVGLPDSRGSTDYYITFHGPDDTWSDPINLGDAVNSPSGAEYSAWVSRDRKYLFFMTGRTIPLEIREGRPLTYGRLMEASRAAGTGWPSIWWVDASFLEALRP